VSRGGKRYGQPGKSYGQRTDLNIVRAPQQGTNTVAAAGVEPPPCPLRPVRSPGSAGAGQNTGADHPAGRPERQTR
jgi:hypothetical protein